MLLHVARLQPHPRSSSFESSRSTVTREVASCGVRLAAVRPAAGFMLKMEHQRGTSNDDETDN